MEKLKEKLISGLNTLHLKGLITGIEGNISVRIAGFDQMWITPSGPYKPWIKEEDLIRMKFDGEVVEGRHKPSIEWKMHAEIYKRRNDVNAIVHAHNPFTLGLTLAGVNLEPITAEAALIIDKLGKVAFAYPGSEELAKKVGEEFEKGKNAVILENHGVVCSGTTLEEALSIAEVLEEVAIALFVSKMLGNLKKLSDQEVKEVIRMFHR
ncbi:MAG: class II aldolase/adducin family protein [Candidatus Methanomethylicota archaeon]|uniref:Class II aldolase/adducin family protein n=1 Tax=Thermoproteota archaeon TaxID=2056631 RepID=A0A497EVK9_9CREN|nr:MAG: class II aldolase/adducin family protein [Candidatus Verstraetearchaeota archaeon]